MNTVENKALLLNLGDLNAATRHKTLNKINTLLILNHLYSCILCIRFITRQSECKSRGRKDVGERPVEYNILF